MTTEAVNASGLKIDRATLTPVVRRALGDPAAEPLEWENRPLGYARVWETTGGVHRVRGTALVAGERRQFRLVLKIARAPAPGASGQLAGTAAPGSADYWKREAELFRDGVLDGIAGGFAPPACYGVEEPTADTAWIWLEEVEEAVGNDWPVGRFFLAARHLGGFTGRYLTGEPLPEHPSFCLPSYLRPMLTATAAMRAELMAPEVWEEPAVRAALPPEGAARYRRLWNERSSFLDLLDRLPRVFVHRDPFRNNLIARRRADGSEQTVALDWMLAGPGHLGEDAWKMVQPTLIFMREPCGLEELDAAVFEGYLAGLRDAGWGGDVRMARLAYCATAAVMAVPPGQELRPLRDPAAAEQHGRLFGRTADEVRAAAPGRFRFFLERAEEARALAHLVA